MWDLLFYKRQECCSPFADAVLYGRIDLFGERGMEAMINFKWRKFGRRNAYFLIFLYILYLVLFMSIVTLDCDRIKLEAKVKNTLIILFIFIVLVIGAVFLSSEIKQLIHRPYYYIRNIYNLVDVVSLIMPMEYVINLLFGGDPFKPAYIGASVFSLYFNFVSFFISIYSRCF